jgi:Do/DeqQ family serine protease
MIATKHLGRRAGRWTRATTVCMTVALAAASAACQQGDNPITHAVAPTAAVTTTAPGAPGAPAASYADTVARVVPAVLTVRSARRVRLPRQHPFVDDPALQQFFSGPPPAAHRLAAPEYQQYALGSGVIVAADGVVLTNHHVVDGAEQITVELTDGRTFVASVVGVDPPSDLAVLKVDAANLPTLSLADSDAARVGDVVLAVGNPLGIGQTVTSGIISAKGRATGLSDGSFEDFLQTDAAINQGNSGGALVNVGGELVGINSQIISPTGTNIGIGFAIPSNMARSVMDQLLSTGKVRRGQLGVVIQPVTPEVVSRLGLADTHGVLVAGVTPDSAAAHAGLREGDVIVSFNGTPVADGNTLRNLVAGTPPGTQVTLGVVRDGRERPVQVTLGEYVAQPRVRQ